MFLAVKTGSDLSQVKHRLREKKLCEKYLIALRWPQGSFQLDKVFQGGKTKGLVPQQSRVRSWISSKYIP